MTTIKFVIPETMAPLFEVMRQQIAALDAPSDMLSFINDLHTGEVELDARDAERFGIAIGELNMNLMFTRGLGIREFMEVNQSIAQALWNQAYDHEDKLTLVLHALEAGMNKDDVVYSLTHSYGAVEAEVLALFEEAQALG